MNRYWLEVDSQGKVLQSSVLNDSSKPSPSFGGEMIEADTYHPLGSVRYLNNEFLSIPNRPSSFHTFDYEIGEWVDPRQLEDFKSLKWNEIKAARTEVEFGPFTYNGMEFDGDLDAQRRLAAYVSVSKSALASSQTFSADFTLANNSVVNLTAEDFVGIELAKVQAVAAAFAKANALRLDIENATTIEELGGIVWT